MVSPAPWPAFLLLGARRRIRIQYYRQLRSDGLLQLPGLQWFWSHGGLEQEFVPGGFFRPPGPAFAVGIGKGKTANCDVRKVRRPQACSQIASQAHAPSGSRP